MGGREGIEIVLRPLKLLKGEASAVGDDKDVSVALVVLQEGDEDLLQQQVRLVAREEAAPDLRRRIIGEDVGRRTEQQLGKFAQLPELCLAGGVGGDQLADVHVEPILELLDAADDGAGRQLRLDEGQCVGRQRVFGRQIGPLVLREPRGMIPRRGGEVGELVVDDPHPGGQRVAPGKRLVGREVDDWHSRGGELDVVYLQRSLHEERLKLDVQQGLEGGDVPQAHRGVRRDRQEMAAGVAPDAVDLGGEHERGSQTTARRGEQIDGAVVAAHGGPALVAADDACQGGDAVVPERAVLRDHADGGGALGCLFQVEADGDGVPSFVVEVLDAFSVFDEGVGMDDLGNRSTFYRDIGEGGQRLIRRGRMR